MNIINLLATEKKHIDAAADIFFGEKLVTYEKQNHWQRDSLQRLVGFNKRGKSVRGSLVLIIKRFLTDDITSDDIHVALSLELIHSGLLIHDDIMDNDRLRRGKPTLFAQYSDLLKNDELGKALAICVGDLAFFLSYDCLGKTNIIHTIPKILQTISHEIALVSSGQMQDIALSIGTEKFDQEAILNVYTYKTARYTFSLPYMIGSLLSNQTDDVTRTLEHIGMYTGLVYQIRDEN